MTIHLPLNHSYPVSVTLFFILSFGFFSLSYSYSQDQATPSEDQKLESKTNIFNADFQNSPTYIRSNTMTFYAEKREVEYKGNIEVLHEDMRLSCDRMLATYTEDNQIDHIYAYDNVFITRESGTRARSEEAIYEKESETILLKVNPEIQENGSVVTADVIRIFLNEDRSEAEGQVRVKLVQPKEEKEENRRGTPASSPSSNGIDQSFPMDSVG